MSITQNPHKLFAYCCKHKLFEPAKHLWGLKHHECEIVFQSKKRSLQLYNCVYCHGNIEFIQWMLSQRPWLWINQDKSRYRILVNQVCNLHSRGSEAFALEAFKWYCAMAKQHNTNTSITWLIYPGIFHCVCVCGWLDTAQWMYSELVAEAKKEAEKEEKEEEKEKKKEEHLNALMRKLGVNFAAFRTACFHNHLHVAQWLSIIQPKLLSDANMSYIRLVFNITCSLGALEVVKWLHSLNRQTNPSKPIVNVSAKHCHVLRAFRFACEFNRLNVVEWFHSLDANMFRYEMVNSKIVCLIGIMEARGKPVRKRADVWNECVVCYEPEEVQTNCGHPFCKACLNKCITTTQKTCPYCRKVVTSCRNVVLKN